jgi:putative peptidoglycan lipid II flippase
VNQPVPGDRRRRQPPPGSPPEGGADWPPGDDDPPDAGYAGEGGDADDLGDSPGDERIPRRGWRTVRRGAGEEELHYGEASRRQARALGLRGAPPEGGRFPDGGGRFGAAAHDPILGWYEPDATTGELPIADELRRLRESQAAGAPVGLAEPPPPASPYAPPPAPPAPGMPVPPAPAAPGVPGGPSAPIPPADLFEPSPAGEPAPPEPPAPPTRPPGGKPAERPSSGRSSMLVAAGIMLSRFAGLLREMLIGRYLGTTAAADAFKAALRIPNTLQNLLGEGVLSASFIPVYVRMRTEGDEEGAGRLAGAICALLLALSGVLTFVGLMFAEQVTAILVTGFSNDARFDLTVDLVRIMFPAMGLMPLSAWCLGVLNSHRKFFLSYVAPVVWNFGQIATLMVVALIGASRVELAEALAWGVLLGSLGQVAVQLPSVVRTLGVVRLSLNTRIPGVRTVLSRFGPVVMGRGVVQILGYVDLWLASFLAVGAVSSLTYAQVLYLLPISVFGMSVAAAELPDLSEVSVHDPETRRTFRRRLEDGMARILFYVAPTTALFIVVGDVIVRVLFQRGAIGSDDTIAIWYVIAAFSLGLPATTASRLLQNALYALGDARTPARLAAVRVSVAALVGLALMFPLDRLTVVDGAIHGWGDIFALGPLSEAARTSTGGVPHLGIVGLALGAAVSSWLEYRMLSTAVAWRIGRSRLGGRWINPISAACVAAALVAFGLELVFGDLYSLISAPLILGPAGLAYLGVAYALGVPEAKATFGRVTSLLPGR